MVIETERVFQDRDLAVYIRIQKGVDFVLGVVIGRIFLPLMIRMFYVGFHFFIG